MMIKFSNINNGTNRRHRPPDVMQWETRTTAEVVFLPKMSGPNFSFFFFGQNLCIENHQKNPENKTFYQTPAWTPKMSTSIKTKREKWDYDYSRLKEMRYTSQIKCMILHWILDLGRRVAMKDILEDYLFKNIINIKFLQCIMIGDKVFMAEVSWWLHITFKWFG